MNNSNIIFMSTDEIIVYNTLTKEYLTYKAFLTVKNSKTTPVKLVVKEMFTNSFIQIEPEKTFTGKSVSEVYGKFSKWLYKQDLLMSN
jgi:hypothetical protein